MAGMSWMRKRGRAVWLLAVPAAVVGLAACGGGSDEAAPSRVVQDFRAIQVGEPKVEILRGGTAAVIRVTTDPPTVCAAAYGESEALGRVANDPGMGGSAITDHSVTLRSLAPNTTYFFRLTATDAAGGVYQTRELLTFTTEPPPRDPAASGRNVALGATVLDVSSSFSEAFAASNALDGDLTTEWSSAGDGNDASLTVDLGGKVEVTGVAFRTREMADGLAITRSFSLVVDDGTRLGPFTAGDRQEANVAAVSFTGRILRFEVEASTGGNTGASEIEVYRREG
jgi:chitodextrinase